MFDFRLKLKVFSLLVQYLESGRHSDRSNSDHVCDESSAE